MKILYSVVDDNCKFITVNHTDVLYALKKTIFPFYILKSQSIDYGLTFSEVQDFSPLPLTLDPPVYNTNPVRFKEGEQNRLEMTYKTRDLGPGQDPELADNMHQLGL